jgi:hypothetical protein
MGTIKDESMNYQPKNSVKNISELKEIDTNIAVFSDNEAEFPYKYIEIEEQRYKIPDSVFKSLKEILKKNPNLKKFSVSKSGTGMNTSYIVIPIA